ncbi:ribosomal protein S15 family protein [Arabidopsis lyrata subsp. lyrata]|uniref:Small ribosomal subunit protein uS15c n=1 Tax=Arabidopsis lyrata subsp. lyrata TaxID=81972 RepID=D7KX37_ARALL|nr:ribosomal protein S15 family protein [Arabidopsis lyrata subsp. lyrata]
MALHLARPKQRLHSNPSLIHLFSTSSSSPQDGNESSEQPSQSPSSSSSSPPDFKISSYFSGIRSSLKQTQPQDGRRQFVRFDAKAPNPATSLSGNQDIRRNLNEFRSRAVAPPPRDWQDIYKQNVLPKSGDSYGTRKIDGTNIKENLRQMRPQATTESKWATLSGLQNTMKTNLKFNENLRSNVIGGGGGLPYSVFEKELEQGQKNENETEEMKSEFIKSYDPIELGEKLRLYRPVGKKELGWFSLNELNQRLVKLRAMEEEQFERTRTLHPSFVKELRSAYENEKAVKAQKSVPCSKYMLEPPKDQLVETYFHPDNMSSAEKMKIELAKVREEFKMSESDCGSARVQVAQLTTKIKHLSSVLHKKDKHSRKGLIAMVQRRKKLLKYMRRTDWDSYCLSLSKLGLRDNPDYKF